MTLFKSGILLASAASLLAISACNPARDVKPADQPSKGPVAATVNGTAISQRTVDMIVKQGASFGPSGHARNPARPSSNTWRLQMVIAEEAIKKGLDKTPEVAEQMDAIRQSVLANAYVQDFIKNNPVTDDMLKAEYERIKATVTGHRIQGPPHPGREGSRSQGHHRQTQEGSGAFEKLAMEKSKDPGSKAKGGDLGWFDPSRMVPEFGAAVSKLEKGKFTEEPVKTQFGYHVILLEDSRPIEAPPMEEVKPQLNQQLQQQNLKKQLDALKATAKIEIVGASAAAASAPASSAAK